MKRLLIIRHAKSSWDDPLIEDHARVLNARGQAGATAMGTWLKAQGYGPDLALVSDAARTQETFARLALGCTQIALPTLYNASSDRILQHIHTYGAEATTLAVIAHNPGIGDFAHRLLRTPMTHPRFADYPTCATLVAEAAIDDWRDLQFARAEALDFRTPADLPQT